jgi:Mrp family chromosome partitioning ATPase
MRAADFVVDNPSTPYSLALAALLNHMMPGRAGRGRVVALTAPGSGAEKSVIALGLARVAAGQGLRTVLLDGDFNRPVIAPAVGFRSVPTGIAELLGGSAPLSRALLRDPRSGVLLLSAARPTGAVQALWTSPKMAELLNYFRQNCDLVIIDAAPALADMPFLARLCDQVVLIAQGQAPQAVLDAAMRSLVACGAPQTGLVVTR